MKIRLSILLCSLITTWQCTFAEEQTVYNEIREELNSIFEYVDKDAVPTGLLAEYGFHLAQLGSYDGVPTDSNYVSRMKWEMLYAGLYDSPIRCRSPGLQISTISEIKH